MPMLVGGLEGAVAVAQQHAHVAGVGGREVELAVGVEVADRERKGLAPVAEFTAGWNVPSALPSSTLTVLLP